MLSLLKGIVESKIKRQLAALKILVYTSPDLLDYNTFPP